MTRSTKQRLRRAQARAHVEQHLALHRETLRFFHLVDCSCSDGESCLDESYETFLFRQAQAQMAPYRKAQLAKLRKLASRENES